MKRALVPLLLLCIISAAFSCSNPPTEVVIYVSPDGDDANIGTEEHPVQSLITARALAENDKSGLPKKVVLRGGEYYNVAVTLDSTDAGLTIEAAPGETPVLYGGKIVTGWEKDGEFIAAKLDGVKEGQWDFRSLVVNGELRQRSRLPEDGAFVHESTFDVRWMSTTGGGWERKPTGEELTTMKYREGDLGPWLDVNNAELTVYHAWDESVVGLESIDLDRHIVRFSNPSGHPPGGFSGWLDKAKTYVVWNVREGMTRPGQWYLDRTAGKVVYWPLAGEDMAALKAVAPTTERIFTLGNGADNITIDGLTLSCTTTPLIAGGFGASRFAGAISTDECDGCTFTNLTVKAVGGWAFKDRGDNTTIEHCTLEDIGAGGIRMTGTDNVIRDCHIHHIGEIYPSAIAVMGGGENLLISHNEIHHTPYSAISSSASHSLIESNVFHDTMQVLSDGAAIYITFCEGTVMRGNIVRGSRGSGPAHAYYMDEQSDGCIVEGNLAVNTAWPSHNHMARGSIIRNNVFIDDGGQLLTFPRSSGMIFEKNILAARKITIRAHTKEQVTPENLALATEVARPYLQKEGISSWADNIMYSTADSVMFHEQWGYGAPDNTHPLEPRDGTVFADPMFTDPADGDFSFKPGSPAPEMGILPIDVSGAGLLE